MKKAILLILLGACASSAHSGWRFAEWQMTKQELQNASGEPLVTDKQWTSLDKKTHWAFSVLYEAAGVKLRAHLGFDATAEKLVAVKAQPIGGGDCGLLKSPLIERYGKPLFEERTEFRGEPTIETWWEDKENNNKISFISIRAMGQTVCSINYTPLRSARGNGL